MNTSTIVQPWLFFQLTYMAEDPAAWPVSGARKASNAGGMTWICFEGLVFQWKNIWGK